MTLKKIVVSASLLLLLIGIVLYHIPQHVQKSYIAVGYKNQWNDEIKTNLDLDVTIKKRLFSKHIIDGTLSIGGQASRDFQDIYVSVNDKQQVGTNYVGPASNMQEVRDVSHRLFGEINQTNPNK
ncbi:hypothetical protein BVG16_22180 [Paenibacillus selenitireducens]|uniref:Uncharacterized protein n=1 Tax=Paenibacillus selenitireducens TaxID=1324314 RepID=A0A1T2X6K3_9BACL|nr:hypothetical protein [Paenibacillus selenitireducens]OPA75306.1 hypothetical protein BVG16_22180 [Paenibacillus selenitireducens]